MKPRRDEAVRAASAAAAEDLMRWAAEAAHMPLPPEIRDRAALVLADNIGAMVAAASEPGVARSREVFARGSCAAEASVFAPGTPRLDRVSAASANGMAAAWCELDEGFRGAPCHAGAYVIPALVAEAEAHEASFGAVLSCLAVAYEVTARMARAFPFPAMTVHPHAAFATIGAAAGVSLIRGHDAGLLLDAVSGAASMSFAGPYGHAIEGALVRNAWTSAGASVGMRSADFAEVGIAGLPETFYDVFATAFGTSAQPDALSAGLGTEWSIAGGYHKMFACCQYAHGAIEATLAMRERLGTGRRVEDIEEILVETHPRGLTLTAVEPRTVLSAKFSMPHAMAATAVAGHRRPARIQRRGASRTEDRGAPPQGPARANRRGRAAAKRPSVAGDLAVPGRRELGLSSGKARAAGPTSPSTRRRWSRSSRTTRLRPFRLWPGC